MTNEAMSKLSAGFLVLVMALAALVLFPVGNVGQTTSSANIYVPVVSSGSPIPDAWVNLTDVHTGVVIAATYDTDDYYYYVTAPPSGYYMVSVIHPNYLDVREAAEVSFTGRTNVTVPAVDLTALPSKTLSIEVTVLDTGALPVTGAYVSVYDEDAREFVAHAATTTNISGKATISMFNTNLIPGHTFYMVARKPQFEMNATAVTITTSNPITMELAASKRISGIITDTDGPASGVVSYMINKDNSLPWVKRVMRVQGAIFAFDAYDGDFVLVMDADGAGAITQERTVTMTENLGTILLPTQPQRISYNNITWWANFTGFSFSVEGDWPYDVAHPGLMYSDMGNLRMQVDLIYGDGDGLVETDEVTLFTGQTYGWGPEYVASDALLTVNDTVYYSENFAGWPYQLAEGSVLLTDSVPFGYTCDYDDLAGLIDTDSPEYDAIAYPRFDTPEVDNKYTIVLPAGYELVGNKTQYTDVAGYLTVTLDPPIGSSTSEAVELYFEENQKPSTTASMVPISGEVYAEKDANGTVLRYYVKVGTEVTFSAVGSSDPNGDQNPLLYTWDFADGTTPVSTANVTYVYNYSSASALRMVSLNVSDVAGLYNMTEIEVICDNADPTPVIWVKDKTVNVTDTSITVNQREAVTFSANNSYDYSTGTSPGLIDYFEFDYGEGNKSSRVYWTSADKNVTHTFADAGTWNVTLTVTDVTGHWTNATLYVHVNDTTDPSTSFRVINSTGGSSLTEKQPLWFNASATTDNLDSNATLLYQWTFGDGTWLNGTGVEYINVTHTYDTPKTYSVSLNVTDASGNYKVSPKAITVGQGPRPKLTVDAIYYNNDPSLFVSGNFTEDKTGYILINMTNTGSWYATGIQVNVYMIKADGTEQLLGTATEILNATTLQPTSNVSIGGKIQVRFPWSFDTKGTYTIKVNVTATDQLNPTIYTSPTKLAVKEAGWKQIVLWVGVAAVVILVPTLIFLRSRWSKREKKGPRREKKEKSGAAEEEL